MLNSIFRFKRSLIVFLSDIFITLIGLALAILLRYGFAYSILEVYATNWILIASTLASYALTYT
jgi:hypothetical protein